ncbi:MAG: hypothetical protein GY854_06480 [Deltaproteobacteria bacterium]|nr:hypothetical protein [Deltaproteobacteria bacterium]
MGVPKLVRYAAVLGPNPETEGNQRSRQGFEPGPNPETEGNQTEQTRCEPGPNPETEGNQAEQRKRNEEKSREKAAYQCTPDGPRSHFHGFRPSTGVGFESHQALWWCAAAEFGR